MVNPEISIIIPVYNPGKFINKCLNSIIHQTFKNIEILCIDDGSTDNSLNILKEFQKNDKRIRIFSQENLGAAASRNLGIENSKGNYILFVDADDWIEEDMCEKLYNHAEHLGSDMVLFNSIEHKPNNQFRERIYFDNNNFKEDYKEFTFDYNFKKNLVMNSMLVVWSKFYSVNFLRKFDLKFSNHEIFNDVQFHIKSMLHAKKISYFPEILYHYIRLDQPSLQNTRGSTKVGLIIFDIFKEIKEYLLLNGFYSEFELEFLRFILNQSEVRLDIISIDYKEEFFNILKHFILSENFSIENLKKLSLKHFKFYVHIINSKSYFEFILFHYSADKRMQFDEIEVFMNKLREKNEIILNLKEQINNNKLEVNEVFECINNDFSNGNFINFEAFKKIKKMNLFDYDFYKKEYNYDLDIDSLLHYIYLGWKENKNPNNNFDSKFYASFDFVKNSGLNPLVYFVMYGLDEGNIKINKQVHQPKAINKILLKPKIEKYDYPGVTDKKRNPKVIVSLTTYPKRIDDIQYTLFSIFNQSFKPDKIILWLAEEEFPNKEMDIPWFILNFKKLGLEIKWCENIKSYKKLIPSLKEYPNDIIVTADDDIFYPKDWLKKLYDNYLKYPDCIIGQRARKMCFDDNGEIDSYNNWKMIENEENPSFLNFLTGGAGSLYPPNSLDKHIFDNELFESLCLTGDDVWFWAMGVINRTKFKTVDDNLALLTYVSPARDVGLFDTENTLWHINSQGKNDDYIKKVIEKFPEINEIIKEE